MVAEFVFGYDGKTEAISEVYKECSEVGLVGFLLARRPCLFATQVLRCPPRVYFSLASSGTASRATSE
jgi:hypothetical protein